MGGAYIPRIPGRPCGRMAVLPRAVFAPVSAGLCPELAEVGLPGGWFSSDLHPGAPFPKQSCGCAMLDVSVKHPENPVGQSQGKRCPSAG